LICGLIGGLTIPVEASPLNQYLVEVDTQGLNVEVCVDERYKDEVSVIVDGKIYSINEDNQLVDTNEVFIQPFYDYSVTRTIDNGETFGFPRYAYKDTKMWINCSGDPERRKAYINHGTELLVSVTGSTSNIGTIGTAPEDDDYSFFCTNMSAGTCTWTLTASF